jgi:hypothetical protein
VVLAAPGTLWSIYAIALTDGDLWLMTFDSAVVPAAGTPPLDVVQVPRVGSGQGGVFVPRVYGTGISWAASTQAAALAVVPGAPLLVRARFS